MSQGAQQAGAVSSAVIVNGENRCKLIVNYLPQSMREDELLNLFSRCGKVVSVKIIRDPVTQYSHGYGFVEYTSPDEAAKAITTLKGYPVQHKRLGVSYARVHDKESLRNTNLYVSNLPALYLTEQALRDLFSPYGKIISCKVLKDERTGQLRGTAFIRFDRKEEAENAIKNLNGTHLQGSTQPLTVKVSEDHGKQKGQNFASQPMSYQFVDPYALQANRGRIGVGPYPGSMGHVGRGMNDKRRGGGVGRYY